MKCPPTSVTNYSKIEKIDLHNLRKKSKTLPLKDKMIKFSTEKFEDSLENHLDEETIDYLVDFWVLHDCRAEGVSKIEQQLIKTAHEFEEEIKCAKSIKNISERQKVLEPPRKRISSKFSISNSTYLKRCSTATPENHARKTENNGKIILQLPLREYTALRALQQKKYFSSQKPHVYLTVSSSNEIGNEQPKNEYNSQTPLHESSLRPFQQQNISPPQNSLSYPTSPSPNYTENRQNESKYHSPEPLQPSPSLRSFQQNPQTSTPEASPNQVGNLQHRNEYHSQSSFHRSPSPRPFQQQRYSPSQNSQVSTSVTSPNKEVGNEQLKSEYRSLTPIYGLSSSSQFQQHKYSPPQNPQASPSVASPNEVGNEHHRSEYHSLTPLLGSLSPRQFQEQKYSPLQNPQVSPSIATSKEFVNGHHSNEYRSLMLLHGSSSPRPFQENGYSPPQNLQTPTAVSPNEVGNEQYYSLPHFINLLEHSNNKGIPSLQNQQAYPVVVSPNDFKNGHKNGDYQPIATLQGSPSPRSFQQQKYSPPQNPQISSSVVSSNQDYDQHTN